MFDEYKGSIRLLLTIPPHGIPRLALFKELEKQKVGRTAAYRTIDALRPNRKRRKSHKETQGDNGNPRKRIKRATCACNRSSISPLLFLSG
jgi:hypothetical protein